MREQVTQSVRNALMNGHFRPGQAITVKGISAMLGASVMPAREAMNRLIAEGALQLQPNRMAIVPVLSPQEFDEITDLRCHIEALAAAHAVAHVTPSHVSQLRALVARMRVDGKNGDLDRYLNANFEFHFLLYRLGASPFVLSIIEKLWVRVGPLIRASLNPVGFKNSGVHHAQILIALKEKKMTLLRKAIVEDITTAAAVIRASRVSI